MPKYHGALRDWWREKKQEERETDKKLAPLFNSMRKDNESFGEFKRRVKKDKIL